MTETNQPAAEAAETPKFLTENPWNADSTGDAPEQEQEDIKVSETESGESGENEPEAPTGKKHPGIQKRFNEYAAKVREQKEIIARQQEKLTRFQTQQPAPVKATPATAGPDPNDYELGQYDPGYIRALAKLEFEQYRAQASEQAAQAERERAAREIGQRFVESEKAYAKSDAYALAKDAILSDDVLGDDPLLGRILTESDNPAQDLFALGSNADAVRQALSAPSELARMRAIVKILDAAQPGKPSVPATPKPAGTGQASRHSWENTDRMTQAQFEEMRERELDARRPLQFRRFK